MMGVAWLKTSVDFKWLVIFMSSSFSYGSIALPMDFTNLLKSFVLWQYLGANLHIQLNRISLLTFITVGVTV